MILKLKIIIVIFCIGFTVISCQVKNEPLPTEKILQGLQKLEYNNPNLLVDLDAGFKAIPLPMDFDGDGDYDLLISESGAYIESGIFYFENITGNEDIPVFKRGMKVSFERRRLGADGSNFEVSNINGQIHVITPDQVREKLLIYKNVPQNVFWDDNEIKLPEKAYNYLHYYKNTQWKMIDFDGDGKNDLVFTAFASREPSLRGVGSEVRKNNYKTFNNKHKQLIFLKNKGTNSQPDYENPVEILKENGESLAKGIAIKPMFADFDNDGDLDFIGIGKPKDSINYHEKWTNNFMLYFENIGTKSTYNFIEGKVLVYNGAPVKMESRSTIHSTSIDWNKDGFIDIIAGEESGRISFIKNTGKIINGIPQFLPPQFFQQKAIYVDFGALTTPKIFDWDGDGLEDIISGNEMGHIGFIKNLGGKIPRWDAPKLLDIHGIPIKIIHNEALPNTEAPIWGYSTIDVGYWDEDNLPDILVNDHNGNVVWLKNIGSLKKPKLSQAQPIRIHWKEKPLKPAWVPGTSNGNDLLAPWRTTPYIMDFNKDGLNDLVMLDHEGYLAVYPRSKIDNQLVLNHPERNFIYADGEPILINQRTGSSSGRIKFTFADWDGDGLEDLILSSKPAVDWMKNMGVKNGKIVLQYMGRVVSRTLMGHTDGPVVSDFNKDGIPDLLVGTEHGVFYYWQRPSFEITTTMTSTGKQLPANYKYFKR